MPTTLWFTGLSGSGKSTIAQALKEQLESTGKTVEVLDGDIVREKLHHNLSFSREDIRTNNCLIAKLAKESSADFVLVPVISPYQEDRSMVRTIIGKNFIEIFVNCPLEKCIEKDVKGLYQKALHGEIKNFIGISKSNPYEFPENPDVTLNTHVESIKKSKDKIIKYLEKNKIIN